MATPLSSVYDAFLTEITDLDWAMEEDEAVVNADLKQILLKSIFLFRHPRIVIEIDETEGLEVEAFTNTLTNNEIQVLAIIMVYFWVKRLVRDWKNIKMQYTSDDFNAGSQANHLDKLLKLESAAFEDYQSAIRTYFRSKDGKVYPYSTLAGGV